MKAMRKDSKAIFWGSLLITSLLIGAAYYFNEFRPFRETANPIPSTPRSANFGAIDHAPEIPDESLKWTDKPIKCVDRKLGEFWTNAKDCESADLKNRISIAQPSQRAGYNSPNTSAAPKTNRTAAKTSTSDTPNLRRVARQVPDGLSISCKFAVGKALEIERDLSATNDPAESIWRENYCTWVNEATSYDCSVPSDFFYYGRLCGYGFRTAN